MLVFNGEDHQHRASKLSRLAHRPRMRKTAEGITSSNNLVSLKRDNPSTLSAQSEMQFD